MRGIAIGNALRRKGLDVNYTILSSSDFAFLCDKLNYDHLEVPVEDESALSKSEYTSSRLYRAVMDLDPDVIIVDLLWFPLHNFIDKLPCRKIFLCRQVEDRFFKINLPSGPIEFDPHVYNLVLGIESFKSKITMAGINPIVIRNKDELLPRDEACLRLGLKEMDRNCLIAYNGEPGEYAQVVKDYSYLKDQGYCVFYSTNYDNGLFPIADFYNAFDLVVCGAGYNFFWEMIFFEKESIFVPAVRAFETGYRRVEDYKEFDFRTNGADQLVDILFHQ